jgi:hypothetical protein
VRIQLRALGLDLLELRLIDEVGLVDQKEIGHRDLLPRVSTSRICFSICSASTT